MAHNLFLAMYAFKIKKVNTSNLDYIENNEFLRDAYMDENNKFAEGFVQDIISLLDKKAYKNKQETHGAILDDKSYNASNRTLDIMINGGITGIKQFLIDESGNQVELSKKEIVGLKFFARFWLPANTSTGYIFIQRYGSLGIKPIFDDIMTSVLSNHGYRLVNSRLYPTTTKERQKKFLKYSTIRDIMIVSQMSSHETGMADAQSATIKLNRFSLHKNKPLNKKSVEDALKNHGFSIANRDYEIKATYILEGDEYREEKTVVLDSSEETINVVPNILIPQSCIDSDNYPIFNKMQAFVDNEIQQIIKESKK